MDRQKKAAELENYNEILEKIYLLPRKNKITIDTGSNAFGLALWTLQLASLKSVFKKAISICSEDGEARKYLEAILHCLEHSFVNREIKSSSSLDVNEFCDAVQTLSEKASAELPKEKLQWTGFMALDLLQAYITALQNGIFATFDIDDGDYL